MKCKTCLCLPPTFELRNSATMFVCLSCKEVESGVQARPFWFEPHSRMNPAWCSIHATTSDMFALHHSCLVCTQSAQHVCTLESGFSPRPACHGYLCQMGPRARPKSMFFDRSLVFHPDQHVMAISAKWVRARAPNQ